MSNFIHVNEWDVIIYSHPNFNGDLVKSVRIWKWVSITCEIKQWILLFIHTLMVNQSVSIDKNTKKFQEISMLITYLYFSEW